MSTARVDFTRGAAERIAAVVRKVEGGDRDGIPLKFRKVDDGPPGSPLKLATFTADWQTGEYQVVTFWNVTSTPNTANVINLTTPSIGFSGGDSTARFVIYGKVKYTTDPAVVEIEQGGSCLVIGGVDLGSLSGFDESKVQMLGHEAGGAGAACLKWFDVFTCATA